MAITSVKEEPFTETEIAIEELDITVMKWESTDTQESEAKDKVPEENALISITDSRFPNKPTTFSGEALESKQPQTYFRNRARLINNGFSANMIINSTRSLLDDFYLMSLCSKSLYCSKIQCAPLVVKCNGCGKHFMGQRDRVLKLMNHMELKHHRNAQKLLLDLIKRYSALLERMRMFLQKDRLFIAAHYD